MCTHVYGKCESWISIDICVLNSGLPLPVCKPFEHIIIIIVLIDVGRKKIHTVTMKPFWLWIHLISYIRARTAGHPLVGVLCRGRKPHPPDAVSNVPGSSIWLVGPIHHPQAQRGPTLWIWTQHLDLRFWYWYLLHLCGLPPLWIWV